MVKTMKKTTILLSLVFIGISIAQASNLEDSSREFVKEELKKIDQVDLNHGELIFDLMGDLEGRSIILKIKDKDKKTIGVFKPSSGSTLHRGEYASFKLASAIDFNAYSPAALKSIDPKNQNRIIQLLESIVFDKNHGEQFKKDIITKERNRKIILEELKQNIKTEQPLDGVYKTWIKNISFYMPLGTIKGLKKHPVYKYLNYKAKKVPHKKTVLKQCTKIFKPTGCTSGFAYLDELTKDMSTIILLDSVIGNADRFPGGNLHFRALNDKDVDTKPEERDFKEIRLLSLDNGAVLKPNDKTGLNTLKTLKISKFVKEHVQKLKNLQNKKDPELRQELGLSPEEFVVFKSNLKETLEYIDSLEKKIRQ
jgi:hypothetical protein